MCSETSEAVGTTWEHAQLEFQKFLKIRIALMSRKASPPCWTTAIGRDLEENVVNRMGLQLLRKTKSSESHGSYQSECVERVKAQQEARKSDPRGHEGRPSRGFGDTSPARELP